MMITVTGRLLTVLVILVAAACTSNSPPEPTPSPSSPSGLPPSGIRATKLIVALPREGPNQEALVGGPLGVDAAGCVTVGGDDYILIAPPGSKLVADGTAVEMPGYGVIALGDVLEASGGVHEDVTDPPEHWKGCAGRYFVEVAPKNA